MEKAKITFREVNPEAAKLWVDEMNNGMTPDNMLQHSGKTVYLRCANNPDHLFQKKVLDIPQKPPFGCPYCRETRPIVQRGINDLFTVCPESEQMWDWDKNSDIDPYQLLPKSRTMIHFKCTNGHSFTKSAHNFTRSPKCPLCKKEKYAVASYPYMIRQWDFKKNKDFDVNLTSANSSAVVWWRCKKCGYEWQAQISSRRASKGWCPCCENRTIVTPGITDLFSAVPDIKADYDFSKNTDIDVGTLSVTSMTSVWWKCHVCGHEWSAYPSTRTIYDNGKYLVRKCPSCSGHIRTKTFDEEYPDLLPRFLVDKNGCKLSDLKGSDSRKHFWWHCDICGEDFEASLASMVHSKETMYRGCSYCAGKKVKRENSFAFLHPEFMDEYDPDNTVDPYNVTEGSTKSVKWICRNNKTHRWESSFKNRANGYGGCKICRIYQFEKMFYEEHPEFEAYYDAEKNERPFISYSNMSNESVWWKCSKGHSFKWTVMNYSRDNKFSCPYCDQKWLQPGVNTLADTHPDLASEWSDANDQPPTAYFKRSNENVLWKCPTCKGEYLASIRDREYGDDSCPYCAGKRVLAGFNSLADKKPGLIAEWSPNNERTPSEFFDTSWESVKWICPTCRGEYSTMIRNREVGDDSCPYCSNRRVLAGFNSLADKKPKLIAEWSPSNEKGTTETLATSPLYAKWICPICNGEYSAPICDREAGDGSCPYCSNRRVLPGFNSLADKKPELIAEWSPSNEKGATETLATSPLYAKWICPICNGEYFAQICDREAGDGSCPYCSNRRVLPGFNSLADKKPGLLNEWSPINEYHFSDYVYTSSYSALWICPTCHGEYQARICDRDVGDDACPYCSNRRVLPGFNSLADKKPELIAEWSPSNEKGASETLATSPLYAKWICPICNGEYSARICDTEAGDNSCPYCANRRVLAGFNSLEVTKPELVAEWSPNNNRHPSDFLGTSTYSALWICPTCHGEYQARIRDRDADDDNCPYCKGVIVLPGYNSFQSKHPQMMGEWDSISNYLICDPDQILDSYANPVWWNCRVCKHKYIASPQKKLYYERRHMKSCPHCKGLRQKKKHFF